MHDYRPAMTTNAQRLQHLYEQIHVWSARAPRGPEHTAACRQFHEEYDALAFPGGLEAGLARLKALDPWAIEAAIQFLEVAPWFHRSGYITETIVRRLKKARMSASQRERVAVVIIESLEGKSSHTFNELAKLIPVLALPGLNKRFEHAARSTHARTRTRASHAMQLIRSTPEPARIHPAFALIDRHPDTPQ